MKLNDPIVIVAAKRTPLGGFRGALADIPASELGAAVIRGCLDSLDAPDLAIDELIMGCVLPAGQRQAPARQAGRGAGLPDTVGATTVNKVCGSGMKAVMLAHDLILAGSADAVVAGGMESMSQAPYLLPGARAGYRIGHAEVLDHLMLDGLEDAYEGGRPMGSFGEATAQKYGFDRDAQDTYAMTTVARAKQAVADGQFEAEIVPIPTAAGDMVAQDELPVRLKPEKIPTLRPAFSADGTITAASSSANADGAAALTLLRRSRAEAEGFPILATILGHATHSQDPAWFTTAPIPAIRKLIDRIGWNIGDVDLFEINEAFAAVAMAAQRDLNIPSEKLNVNGGACALGHPIGATGARIIVTLIHALKAAGKQRGIASLCIGGGEATAIALECQPS